jgi:hypothetical protein
MTDVDVFWILVGKSAVLTRLQEHKTESNRFLLRLSVRYLILKSPHTIYSNFVRCRVFSIISNLFKK